MFKPQYFNVPATLLVPTSTTVKGVPKKTYVEDHCFFCSFRTFGGTETNKNGIVAVEDTAVVEAWYDDTIKADCRVKINDTEYEILGTPEDIMCEHKYLKFKVRAVKGGA